MQKQTPKTQNQPIIENTNHPFRSAYSKPLKVSISFPAQGRTQQNFKDECDINVIMSRYQQTGALPPNLNPLDPQFLDATGFDFDLAMNLVAEASSAFEELPSAIRARFHHDPGEFLDFVTNPKNRAEMAEMGLLREKPEWAKGVTTPDTIALNQEPSNPPTAQSPATASPTGTGEKKA